jgi:hypothetical protein
MAGGPIFPHSAYPVTKDVFENVHVGDGAYSPHEVGLGLAAAADLSADATWRLRFQMPPSLPTGTCKLRVLSLADAITGAIAWDVQWRSVAVEEDPTDTALNAEGPANMTWSTGDDDQYKESKVTLDADTVVASEEIVMDLIFEDTGTTLAVVSTHHVSIIWE